MKWGNLIINAMVVTGSYRLIFYGFVTAYIFFIFFPFKSCFF